MSSLAAEFTGGAGAATVAAELGGAGGVLRILLSVI